MIKRKNDNKWKYICGVLIIILVLGGLLSQGASIILCK